MIVAIQQNNSTTFPPGVSDLASHDWGAGQLMIPDKSPIFWSELKVQPESSNVHATIALAGIPGQPCSEQDSQHYWWVFLRIACIEPSRTIKDSQ